MSEPMSISSSADLLKELEWRGLIHQITNPDGLEEHLRQPRSVYCGFDPTANSLTIGNLVPIILLKHFQRAGHTPVVVMGGATGLVGDPSGKDAERSLMSIEQIEANLSGQRPIFERILDSTAPNAVKIVNNLDWFQKITFLEALRDIGKYFSVNMMIQKDSVKARLNERNQGISYTEFSYMLLQSYDFQRLYEDHQVTVELGGSDQWGNIVGGVDLVRRAHQSEVFGLTSPLVTKADGSKFGKSEAGAIWLTADKTGPYALYQYFLNTSDADINSFLKRFTLLDKAQIEATIKAHEEAPHERKAQTLLAEELTTLLHGEEGLEKARAASSALFGGDFSQLDAPTLEAALAAAPCSEHARSELSGDGLAIIDALVQTSLCKSKREARTFLESGAITINGEKASLESILTTSHLLHERFLVLKRGKKLYHLCKYS